MPFPPTPSNTPSNTATPSNTPSNTPTNTPSGTSCPNPTLTLTPTLTMTPTTPQTIYMNLCLPSVVPEDGIIDIYYYSQVSPDCASERVNVDQTIGLNFDIFVCEPPYGPDNCVSFCPGYIVLTAGTSCNSSFCNVGIELAGFLMSGQTYEIFPIPTGSSINYEIGIICTGSTCAPCITPTPTPTLTHTPTLTSTPTVTPTLTRSACVAADYLLFNETGSPLSWNGLLCNGNGIANTIAGGQQASTGCLQVGSLNEGSLTIVSTTPC